jgi:GntR family transcriptional repressor for pyruvate dehydrogenase complex
MYDIIWVIVKRTVAYSRDDVTMADSALQPNIPPIGRTSVRERIEDVLTDLILKGTYSTGDLLPSQAQLSQSLGVSRVALREAMRALEARGLVETIQGKGILVKEPHPSYASEALSLLLERETATLVDLWDARLVLEVGIVERACCRATPEELEALQHSIDRWSEPSASTETLVVEDERFHSILVQAAHNPVLELLMATLAELLRESRRTTLRVSPGPDIRGHTGILDAMRAKDSDAAREAMVKHLEHAKNDLVAAGIDGWADDSREQ